MFIRRKTYNELIIQKNDYERIAHDTIQLNGRVIESNERILEEMKSIQELNHNLQQRNEELVSIINKMQSALDTAQRQIEELEHQLTGTEIDLWDAQATAEAYKIEKADMKSQYIAEKNECDRLRAKLEFAIQQRDYYYDLLESTEGVHVGDVIVKEETDE